jgi:hypothetical protein
MLTILFLIFQDIAKKTTEIHRKAIGDHGNWQGRPQNTDGQMWELFEAEGFHIPLKLWTQFYNCMKYIEEHKFASIDDLEKKTASFYDKAVCDFILYHQYCKLPNNLIFPSCIVFAVPCLSWLYSRISHCVNAFLPVSYSFR